MTISVDTGSLFGRLDIEGDVTVDQAGRFVDYLKSGDAPGHLFNGQAVALPGGFIGRARRETRYILDVRSHQHTEGLLHWAEEPPGDYPEAGISTTVHLVFGPGETECGLDPEGWLVTPLGMLPTDSRCKDCSSIVAEELGLETP